MRVPDEGYSSNMSCAMKNSISTFKYDEKTDDFTSKYTYIWVIRNKFLNIRTNNIFTGRWQIMKVEVDR